MSISDFDITGCITCAFILVTNIQAFLPAYDRNLSAGVVFYQSSQPQSPYGTAGSVFNYILRQLLLWWEGGLIEELVGEFYAVDCE